MRSTRFWLVVASLLSGIAFLTTAIPQTSGEEQPGASTPSPDAIQKGTDGTASLRDAASVIVRPREGLPLDLSEDEVKRRGELLAAIKTPVSIDCRDLPLAKVIREITQGLPIRVKFDEKAILDDGTVSMDDPVTLSTENEPVESILFDLLQPRQLTWIPRGDSLVVTTWTEADAILETVAYDVTDLVVDDDGHANFTTLESIVRTTIDPDLWPEGNAPGTVIQIAREHAALLVVRQTFATHRKIGLALSTLHRTGLVSSRSSTRKIVTHPRALSAGDRVIAPVEFGQKDSAQEPIPLKELRNRDVVGRLGLPLGTATEVEAEVVSGDSTRRLADRSRYLLRVTHVDGKELADSALMHFELPGFASVKLANDHWSLLEMKQGKEAEKQLDTAQLVQLEQGYVGKRIRLAVYEAGKFDGLPKRLPKDFQNLQGYQFRFSTFLVVLAERRSH